MPSIGGAAAGALGGLATGGPLGAAIGGIAGLFGGGKPKLQKQIESKINPALENSLNMAGQAQDQSKTLRGMSVQDFSKAGGFYRGLLSDNDTTALNKLLGPQRTGINQAYENQINTLGRTGGRGGGRTSTLMDYDFQKNRELLELVPQARMMGAQGLTTLGGTEQQGALGFGDLAVNNTRSVLGAAGIRSDLAGESASRGAGYADLGAQIGKILAPMLAGSDKVPGWLGGKKKTAAFNPWGVDISS